jgi:hypothetical protein
MRPGIVEIPQRTVGSGFQSFIGKAVDLDEFTRDIARVAGSKLKEIIGSVRKRSSVMMVGEGVS